MDTRMAALEAENAKLKGSRDDVEGKFEKAATKARTVTAADANGASTPESDEPLEGLSTDRLAGMTDDELKRQAAKAGVPLDE